MQWRTLVTARRALRKLSLVASSELLWTDKLRYIWDACTRRRAPALRNHLNSRAGFRDYRLRGEMSIRLREGSTDRKVFEEIFLERVYSPCTRAALRQPRHHPQPLILIDLGANIGLSVIYLARELGPARIIAVEPDAGNFSVLLENLRRAGLLATSTALRAFAGSEPGFAEIEDSGNGAWGMRMGPRSDSGIPVLTIAGIAEELPPPLREPEAARIVLKCDIEGAEGELFRGIRNWDRWISFVILEIHTELFPAADLHTSLESSAYDWRVHGEIPSGACIAVIGIERLGEKAAARGLEAGAR
jgi:FkbM family methyltransferase